MGFITSVLDAIFLIYFIIHVPTTLLVDSQSVIPAAYFPDWAKDAVQWHIKVNDDHLVATNPVWFKSLVWCEALLQLPFFFIASYAFIKRRNWIRIPCIVYGTHVVTTLVPILTDILFGPQAGPKRVTLALIYLPYLVVPLLLVLRMLPVSEPFKAAAGSGKRRNKRNKSQ